MLFPACGWDTQGKSLIMKDEKSRFESKTTTIRSDATLSRQLADRTKHAADGHTTLLSQGVLAAFISEGLMRRAITDQTGQA